MKTRWPGIVAVAGAGLIFGIYLLLFRDSVRLLHLVPYSAAPIAGDVTPWLASLSAGVLAGQRHVPTLRRVFLSLAVIGAGWAGPVGILTRPAPVTQDAWRQGVCLQTTDRTCGPAAVSTLLRHHGVTVTERDMARDCLTDHAGTHLTGLYRGLALHAPEHMTPRAAQLSLDRFIERPAMLPAIVSLQLTPARAASEPRYAEQWGWDVGVMHSVVVLSFETNGTVWIADPGVGLERWRMSGLADLWTGEVLYLARDE